MASSARFSSEILRRLTPEARLNLWQAGVVLGQSPFHLAATGLVGRYQRLLEEKAPEITPPPEPAPDAASAWRNAFEALRPATNLYVKRQEALDAMRAYTLAGLRSEAALGFGFAMPRKPDDAPALIPADVWGGRIDWNGGKVSGEGLEFVSVRLIKASAAAELLPPTEGDASAPRPIGRPSVKADVFAAYEALRDVGKIDFDAPMKRLFPEIRAWLCETYPDRAGAFREMADETIRRVIAYPFKADRAAKKQ